MTPTVTWIKKICWWQERGKKMWFPCSFGKTQKHHILVLLTHLFNELEKKQSHPPKQPVMYSYFPAVRAVHVRHFGFTVQAQQPCLSVRTPGSLFPSNGTGMRKQPWKSGLVEKPPWKLPICSFTFNSHFDLVRCLYIFYTISFQATFCFFKPFFFIIFCFIARHPCSLTCAYLFPSPILSNS